MPAPKAGRKASARSNSSSSSSSGSPARKKAATKPLSSPTLNFAPVAKPAPARPKNADDDSKSMPPPPLPARGTAKSSPAVLSGKASGKGKGKAKATSEEDVIELIESDEDDSPQKRRAPAPNMREAMWTDIYGPTVESELAPGKQRIAKVRQWLHDAVFGISETSPPGYQPNQLVRDRLRKYKRILLVTGPAGIGKATTVRLLAEQLGIDLVEWHEGVEERSFGSSSFDHESQIAKLVSFISRHAYPTLDLSAAGSSQATTRRPRAMLMTSLPNLGHLPTREAFHATLLSLCQTFNSSSCPLIIVHSDSGSGGRAEESWMDRERGGRESSADVVGNDVKLGPWCAEVDFLPLAPTFVTKALNRVLGLAIPDAAKRPSPGAVQLIAQSSNGDLRSSINSLQVLCTGRSLKNSKKRKTDGDGKPAKATGRGSRGGKGAKIDVSEEIRAALDAVTRREQSLNLFHALGKVFYNKRLGDPKTDQEDAEELAVIRKLPPDDPLPEHLDDYERSKSMIQMESFAGTIPIDASTFALWIHSNIPSFCGEVEELSDILDSFCAADVMRTDDDIWQSSPQAIAYALHLTVRGSLMGLPSPVIRANQKVTKPQFFDSYRLERSNASLLDVARGHFAKKAVASSVDWADGLVDDENAVPWGGLLSKDILAREFVPMAVKVQTLSKRPLLPASVQPLVLPPFSNASVRGGVELREEDQVGDSDPLDVEMAGEDGLGAPEASHWDTEADAKDKEELGWLEDDDIEDWD